MLKKRIIACLLLKDGVLHRTKKFVPDYRYTSNFIETTHIDELCFIDLGGSRTKFFAAVNSIAEESMLPLSIGGKIDSHDAAMECFRETPCDKVVIETHHQIIPKLAEKLGAQSVVLGVTKNRQESLIHLECIGEILVQSVERDGSLRGYDLEFARKALAGSIPVVLGSGCCGYRSMEHGFKAGAAAVSTSNIHHFTPSTIKGIRQRLIDEGVELRDTRDIRGNQARPADVLREQHA